jgi:hypothetical protein
MRLIESGCSAASRNRALFETRPPRRCQLAPMQLATWGKVPRCRAAIVSTLTSRGSPRSSTEAIVAELTHLLQLALVIRTAAKYNNPGNILD